MKPLLCHAETGVCPPIVHNLIAKCFSLVLVLLYVPKWKLSQTRSKRSADNFRSGNSNEVTVYLKSKMRIPPGEAIHV
ncbi:hypothetical protein [Pontiella sulfatireligans]|nr:hypothetical protein [Pontiella sulfatireligans]